MRHDFTSAVKKTLAERAGFICSNPDCGKRLVGPTKDSSTKSTHLGIASHICAASAGGPRYDARQTTEQRQSIENAIYLCSGCASKIDKHQGSGYDIELLRTWKLTHERDVEKGLNKATLIAENPLWINLNFDKKQTSLKPALLGNKISANSATACPETPEVNRLIGLLNNQQHARLIGEPGDGKSTCAYQVAAHFQEKGWLIKRGLPDGLRHLESGQIFNDEKTLYLIDDAHLIPRWLLTDFETHSSKSSYVLSTLNGNHADVATTSAVFFDSKRAVKIIARRLMKNIELTYNIIKESDSEIGKGHISTPLEDRIKHASETADQPWKFCFILRGGWKQAKISADNARANNCDIALATLSARQIVSGDSTASVRDIDSIMSSEGLKLELESIKYLAKTRTINSTVDIRTPHQRFSGELLKAVLETSANNDEDRVALIGRLLDKLISDDDFSLSGIRNLLDILRFGSGNYRWLPVFGVASCQKLIDRCFSAVDGEARLYAAQILNLLEERWLHKEKLIGAHKLEIISNWIQDAKHPSGYGVGYLMNSINQRNPDVAIQILEKVDSAAFAKKVSNASIDEFYTLGNLIQLVGNVKTPNWHSKTFKSVEQSKILNTVISWPEGHPAAHFSAFCLGISWWNEDFALDMAEAMTPNVQRAFGESPLKAEAALRNVLGPVLRVDDPLGVYTGKLTPCIRRKKIARAFFQPLTVNRVVRAFRCMKLRDLQRASMLLATMKSAGMVKRVSGVLDNIDWESLSILYRDEWTDMSHEAQVFLGMMYDGGKNLTKINQFILDNAAEIENFPPRLFFLSPEAGIAHLKNGKTIQLVRFSHVNWHFGPFIIEHIAKYHPNLMHNLLMCHTDGIAEALSGQNRSWFSNADNFLFALQEYDPDFLKQVVSQIDPEKASKGWEDSLRAKAAHKRAITIMIDTSLTCDGPIKSVGQKLRDRFPRASRTLRKKLSV